MRRILLIEPSYRNKYPPLGLMKIATYHKLKGDLVKFAKGCVPDLRRQSWDRIYVATLFTFFWTATIRTIEFYKKSLKSPKDLWVGGVAASLLGEEIAGITGATVLKGLLDKPEMLDGDDRQVVDNLIPDYSILDEVDYRYGLRDAYMAYATRGCPNRCEFCAVHKLEPVFNSYLCLKKQVRGIEELFGPKKDLILLDNNVLASTRFEPIMNDILDLGFEKGARLAGRKRSIDFNQGLDARRLTDQKMALIARTAIHPLRIAFDDISMTDLYVSKVRLARDNGILNLSNYVLYNFRDSPKDFYNRLKINVLLNEELGTQIYSFPMKFVPLQATDRSFVGKKWSKKLLRGIQCILLATRGLVSTKRNFFEAAFGPDYDTFVKIAMMPDTYIIYREKFRQNGAQDWLVLFEKLDATEKNYLEKLVSDKKITETEVERIPPSNFRKILEHYIRGAQYETANRAEYDHQKRRPSGDKRQQELF